MPSARAERTRSLIEPAPLIGLSHPPYPGAYEVKSERAPSCKFQPGRSSQLSVADLPAEQGVTRCAIYSALDALHVASCSNLDGPLLRSISLPAGTAVTCHAYSPFGAGHEGVHDTIVGMQDGQGRPPASPRTRPGAPP